MPFTNVTNNTMAQSAFANATAGAGLGEPLGGLNNDDHALWAIAELLQAAQVVTDAQRGGAKGDGVTDDTAAIQAVVDAAPAGSTILFPRATNGYLVTSTITVRRRGITFQFVGGGDQSGIKSTALNPIALGTDDGLDWDASNYNGVAQGFAYVGGYLTYTGTASALNNGLGNYGVGSYGIRDWRGGSVRIENATLSGWDYPFWGVQSDINVCRNLVVSNCHSGIYLGARSDQARFDHIWSFHNDTVFLFEGSKGHLVTHWITDSDGSATTNPAVVRNSTPSRNARYSTTRTTSNVVFDTPWLESLAGGSSSFDVEAFFDLNTGDAVQAGNVTIRTPIVNVQLYSTGGVQHTLHLVKADNLLSVTVDGLTAAPGILPWNNLRSAFKVPSGTGSPPAIWFRDADMPGGPASSTRLIENFSASSVNINGPNAGQGVRYGANVVAGSGNVNQGFYGFQRMMAHNTSPPSGGSGGDTIFNRGFVSGKSWAWVSDGSASHPVHAPTLSADRGDANQTLTPETDHEIQRFATTLTANRTITLSTTSALNGHVFKIVRTGLGAFTLDVGGLKTIPSATAATVEVMYDGSAWRLTGYDLL